MVEKKANLIEKQSNLIEKQSNLIAKQFERSIQIVRFEICEGRSSKYNPRKILYNMIHNKHSKTNIKLQ